jgi:DNA-binding NtrC family response regulator
VLLVEDDEVLRESMARYLQAHGFVVDQCGACEEARALFSRRVPDVVIADFRLDDGDAMLLLPWLRARDPSVAVFILTGFGTIDLAVRALHEGARDFLTKPVQLPRLLGLVQRAADARRVSTMPRGSTRFIARSEAMQRFVHELDAVARTSSPVLLLGETGTGKSTVAREIHARSPRAGGRIVDVNCGGLRGDFLESELFGHERGAFTGAVAAKQGLLEQADGGTLFLDEIGDIELGVQAKILKVLEERRFRRLGDVRERTVDVRLVAATHRDLDLAVRRGTFREDLYYRISTLRLTVPPLRERRGDIEPLVEQLVLELSARHGRPPPSVTPEALAALVSHPWSGNVRELRNVLERALVLHRANVIHAEHLRFDTPKTPGSGVRPRPQLGAPAAVEGEGPMTIRDAERRAIEDALAAASGHVGEAAQMLGMPRSTLYHKLRVLGIETARFR